MLPTRRALLLLLLPLAAAAGPAPSLTNPDFEGDEVGKPPKGWELTPFSREHGFRVRVSEQRPRQGKRCVEIASMSPMPGFGAAGLVVQSVPAEALRGKRVRFRAAVRAEVDGAWQSAALSIRVVRPEGRPGHAADMADRPVTSGEWVRAAVAADVADDAERVEVGFLLHSMGKAWFDDAALDVVGKAGEGNTPPRRLTERGRDNLIALARLLGYVRYFHPSDESAAADWEGLAVEAVGVVEPARSAAELSERLTELFAPFAPTLQVFPTDRPPTAVKLAAPRGEATRLVAWRHVGVGVRGGTPAYRSDRVTDRELPGAAKLPLSEEALTEPGEPFEARLGGGVSCRLPLTLYATKDGTLPRATAKPRPASKPAFFVPTGDDRDTRLADVILAWNVFQHFYPYFDVVKVDWPGVLREALGTAATDADAAAFHDTLRRLVARLDDSHGTVRGSSGTVRCDGALPVVWDWIEGLLVVTGVEPNGADGVKVGDVVKSLDGRPAAERVVEMERLVSGATPQFRRYRALQELRNGPPGTRVKLELQPAKGPAHTVTLTRRPSDDSPLRGPSMRETRLDRIREIEPDILYVDLDRFKVEEFPPVLPRLLKAKGIVFDARGYPLVWGMLVPLVTDKPLTSDRWGQVVTRFPDRRDVIVKESDWTMRPGRPHLTAKVAFVTDGRAVSAAETFLSLIATHKVAPIVGGPTAGSNGGVNVYVLPGGYRVSWTGMRATKRDGSPHHGVGVLPTVRVNRTIRAVAEGRDELVERAVQLVKQ